MFRLLWSKIFGKLSAVVSPYLQQFKLGLLLIAVVASAAGAWYIRSVLAEQEVLDAVDTATAAIQKDLDGERERRSYFQNLSESQLSDMMDKLSNIRIEHKTVTNNITKEREVHKEFYVQQLPPGGFEEWKRARKLVGPSPTPPVQR